MAFDRERPYNDLPELPPACDLETRAVLKQAIAASRALAELKGGGSIVPDQTILLNSIVLQEARASSEIENIVTTNDELYGSLLEGGPTSPAAKEVHRYRAALWRGYELLRERPVATNLMVELAREVRQAGVGVRSLPGTKVATGSGAVVYTPPEGEDLIRRKLANLERFIHGDDGLDPLVRLAVMHYQFEAIHPFTDGNGRVGRILNILYLVEQRLLDLPVLYLSGYILSHRPQYYDRLRRVTEEGAWEGWVLYMLEAVEMTARDSLAKLRGIRNLMETCLQRVRDAGLRKLPKELVELVFRSPYCRISSVIAEGIAKRDTASHYLRDLERLGLLSSLKVGREYYFVNLPVIELMMGLRRDPAEDSGNPVQTDG